MRRNRSEASDREATVMSKRRAGARVLPWRDVGRKRFCSAVALVCGLLAPPSSGHAGDGRPSGRDIVLAEVAGFCVAHVIDSRYMLYSTNFRQLKS